MPKHGGLAPQPPPAEPEPDPRSKDMAGWLQRNFGDSPAVKNMVKNHCLAKAISDVGWGEFVRQLEYKSQWYGRTLIKIGYRILL